MKEPVDHILRPRLPWRDREESPITECGYDATKVNTLTRPEFFARLKEMGQQRTALLTCMTCSDTARRWGDWEDDPRLAMQREIEWERRSAYYVRHPNDRGSRLKDELIAIAAIIEAHKDEFAELVAEQDQRRAWLEKKAKLESRRKIAVSQPRGGL